MQQGGLLYRLRIADGSEYGPSSEADICSSISAGRIAPDAVVAQQPGTDYVSILQVPAFARAFSYLQQNLQPAPPSGSFQQPQSVAQARVSSTISSPHIPSQPANPQSVEGFLFDDTLADPALASVHPAAAGTPGPVYASSPTASGALTPLPMQVDLASRPPMAGQPIDQMDIAVEGAVVDEENAAVAAYLRERTQFEEACGDLEDGRYTAARQKFEALAQMRPKTSEYQASAAYAAFMLASDDKERFTGAGRLREVHEQYPYCVPTLLFLSRASLKIARPKAAVRYLKTALEIEPERRDLQRDLQKAQDAAAGRVTSESSDGVSTLQSLKSGWKERLKGTAKERPKDRLPMDDNVDTGRFLTTMVVYFVVFSFLFGTAVVVGMGKDEYFYEANNGFFYIRRALLLLAGLALSAVFLRDEKIDITDFRTDPKWLAVAIGWGLLIGYLSPAQAVRGSMPIVLVLTFIHVVAEEAFFRVFIARNLARSLSGLIAPTALGGLLFGLYHMSYYSFSADPAEIMANLRAAAPALKGALIDITPEAQDALIGVSSPMQAWQAVGLISLVAGVPYFLLYYLSRSFTAPFLCHLTVNVTMMVLSFSTLKS